jgi:ATP-dependent DNA helicase DinG
VADRLTSGSGGPEGPDVVWLSRYARSDGQVRTSLNVAPLSVAGVLRDRLYTERTVVITSATLTLGGRFEATAGSVGLLGGGSGSGEERAVTAAAPGGDEALEDGERATRRTAPPRWSSIDVGSPFDYPRQGILYLARALPPPGRDGIGPAALDELAALAEAAGGRTLGLFSSRRAAEYAAEMLRERLDLPILCQGDDATPTLVREFARDARTCLFGTLSLWQGVDVPGSACQLVVIDRIPFPRPDDPLTSARQQAVARRGGNGFMSVAATYAGLRLAQGAGRLVRSAGDRGVVAVLDSRLATARYGGFLRASLPPFWVTHDREIVLEALRRIDESAPPLRPVLDPGERTEAVRAVPAPASSRTGVSAGRGWTAEEDAGLRAAVEAGREVGVIAERYDCTADQVIRRMADLGLTAQVSDEIAPSVSS